MSSELAERVGHLPQAYEAGNKSTARLLLDAGLLEKHPALSVDEVEDVLRREPLLTDLWLKRAKDQRLGGGWSIDCGKDEYRVQNYADGKSVVVQGRLRPARNSSSAMSRSSVSYWRAGAERGKNALQQRAAVRVRQTDLQDFCQGRRDVTHVDVAQRALLRHARPR